MAEGKAKSIRVRKTPISSATRSQMMRSIRKTDTTPELVVRKLLRGLGARYRLHARDLPGSPDIVMRKKKKAILVHGCFWHQHSGCKLAKRPSARPEYWLPKLARNQERDRLALAALSELGWSTLVVWECELAELEVLRGKLKEFLGA
ncbi:MULTISPECIES: very short patch repair endonuclease [unclassified Bradyrhizobium]|uniref:very short patch repair endonuclease n=1 Tax=unclassified Bradyrhizobium TaxID=2631580 RepID=UPI00211DD49B|nr:MULTISPECIES: DNA mismatch endonuclease Vsr [unclassified Bradyrhizobium]MDD1536453.1 very short patch repair endonuclease [Bradyrhizobium sp. WBOS8]MDD1586139.1 very short patch repair endonuclease [Bradyrhizobium sp. WBOS4]UUO51057.1 very short patch repair endonuclease [Bradyrhizobium sp. WBOS04]UUO63426.1 very short patch repair endonuclease [Bradyrhizobium sp. WBOS08]